MTNNRIGAASLKSESLRALLALAACALVAAVVEIGLIDASWLISLVTGNPVAASPYMAARWGFCTILFFALWLARPSSRWWKQRALDHRWMFPVCAAIMCCFALAVAVLTYTHTTLKGYDLKCFEQYTDLARALASGHVYLNIEPSEKLLALSNPYEPTARRGIDYMWDYAFFNGKYYTYFGVVPCIVFYLPYYLITGNALPNIFATVISGVAFYAGSVYLVRRLVGRWFPQASVMAVILCCIAMLFGSMSLSLMIQLTLYPVPIASGAACAIWGLALWMRACEGERFAWRFAIAGSFLGALTLGCRPQFFLVFLLILPLFAGAVRGGLVKGWSFFPLVAPVVVVAALMGAYNYARFGSPTDFGAFYNLTTNDMTKHGFSPYVGALGIFAFLLEPPHLVSDWSFVASVDLSYARKAGVIVEVTMGGLFVIAPVLLLGFWFFWSKRLKLRQQGTLIAISVLGVIGAFVLAAFDACASGILLRYQVDMGIFLAVPACVGILAVCSHNGPKRVTKMALLILACISVTLSTLYFLG